MGSESPSFFDSPELFFGLKMILDAISHNSKNTNHSQWGDASVSDIGREREVNEDRVAVIESRSGTAWALLDGMGGVTGGEFAAQLALDAMKRVIEGHECADPGVVLRGAIDEANRAIVLRRQNQNFVSMGTTVVATMIDGMEIVVSHVGDSRAYCVHKGKISQLTVDDTVVQRLVDAGEIKKEEALSHPDAHLLTHCLGTKVELSIPVLRFWRLPIKPGQDTDMLLLCSDGLYGLIADEEIASLVTFLSPNEACQKLVELANARGGFDNISVMIIPINGIVGKEPPADWERVMKTRARQREAANKPPWSLALHIACIATLSVLSACVAAAAFLFIESRHV